MSLIEAFNIETISGLKTIELHHLNIILLDQDIDVLIISTASRDYSHLEGTMIQALNRGFDIDVNQLAQRPEYDLRESLHIWLSSEIKDKKIKRIACVERASLYHEGSFRKSIKDVFGLITMANMHDAAIRTVALPVLGTGAQQIPADRVLSTLVNASKTALEQNSLLNRIIFFEKDNLKLQKLQYEFESIISEIKPEIVFNYNNRTVTINGKKILFSPFEYCYYLYFALRAVNKLSPENFSLNEVPVEFLKQIINLHEKVFPDMLGMRMELKDKVKNEGGRDISTFRAYISKVNTRIKDSLKSNKSFERYSIQKEGKRGAQHLSIKVPGNKIQIIIPSDSTPRKS
jgi:hypothetical protein